MCMYVYMYVCVCFVLFYTFTFLMFVCKGFPFLCEYLTWMEQIWNWRDHAQVSGRREGHSKLGVKHCLSVTEILTFSRGFCKSLLHVFLVQHSGAWSVLVLISSWCWISECWKLTEPSTNLFFISLIVGLGTWLMWSSCANNTLHCLAVLVLAMHS